MTPLQIFLLFLFVCIPTRIGLMFLAKKTQSKWLIPLAIIIGIGFFRQYKINAPGSFSKKPAWWQPFRLFHGLVWLLFALLLIIEPMEAWKILLIDIIVGFSLTLTHYSQLI